MSWQWLNVNFILQEKISQTSKFLYTFSRFNDLKKKADCFSKNEIISKCWIVTNRFTSDAIALLSEMLNLLSWDYPKDNNLKTKNDIVFICHFSDHTVSSRKDKLLILDVIFLKSEFKAMGRMV
jgi:hypothetical protein